MSIFDNLKTSFNRLQNTQITPKMIAICVVSFLAVASLGFFIVKKALSQSPNPSVDSSVSTNITKTSANTNQASAQAGSDKAANKNNDKVNNAASADSGDPYAIIAERNIFKPIDTAGGNSGVPGLVQISKPGGLLPPLTITPLPGFSGSGFTGFGGRGGRGGNSQKIAFTGIVETPDGIQALLENTATLETRYAGVGDSAFGMTVDEVTSRSVALRSNDGQSLNLRLGENKTDTPPTQANTAQQPAQGQTGAQPQAIQGQAAAQPAAVSGIPGAIQLPGGTMPGLGNGGTGRRRGMGNFTIPQPQ